ncbi:BPSL0067 family protein [Polyangium sp. y55x31]|uniref:BPSL0067 family protein n=1 Tax=Polyangium sp. y55x31 TaxID=3042688 RepID=UPI002482AB9B|nr:BPSL0067 family protein [Polyangium sp. y55x31]MDI1476198.1 BPSL0067 family protein [Polyangium sp. y55x31]
MAYRTNTPELYEGRHYGESEQCVALVKYACGAPHTSAWKKGAQVIGNAAITAGTAIACGWEGDRYMSRARGNHAAIYLGQFGNQIEVVDQWSGTPAGRRYKTHKPEKPYHVIEG